MSLRLRDDDLDWRQIDDEIVVLDARDATYLTLNGPGALLWGLLDKSATRDELVAALLAAYEVDASVAGRDTDAFLEMLAEQGLLAA